MQIVRTIVWVLVTIVLVAFIAINWTTVPVNFWPLDNGEFLHFTWPVGVVALVFFLLGMLPMWLLNKGTRWRFNRRIHVLENTVKASSAVAPVAAPAEPPPPESPNLTP
jgi:uncharacterized integral membrane protein